MRQALAGLKWKGPYAAAQALNNQVKDEGKSRSIGQQVKGTLKKCQEAGSEVELTVDDTSLELQ